MAHASIKMDVNPCKAGTFTVSALGEVAVDVGFAPKYVAVLFQGSTGTGSSAAAGAIRAIYDARVSTEYSHKGQLNAASTAGVNSENMSTSSNSRISAVNSSGFKYYNGSSDAKMQGTYYYFAMG